MLSRQQLAVAGKALRHIEKTAGFQVILELLESTVERCGSVGLKQVAIAPAEEKGNQASWWDGYQTCAQHLRDVLYRLMSEDLAQQRRLRKLEERIVGKLYGESGDTVVS